MRRVGLPAALAALLVAAPAAAEQTIVVAQAVACTSTAADSKYATTCDGAATFIRPDSGSIISCHLAFRVTWEARNPAPFNLYYASFEANASTCAEDSAKRVGDLRNLEIHPALGLASSGTGLETSPATVWFTIDKESKAIQVCMQASFQGPTQVVCHSPQMRSF